MTRITFRATVEEEFTDGLHASTYEADVTCLVCADGETLSLVSIERTPEEAKKAHERWMNS